VQRARNGTWDIMGEKKGSKSEEAVRRMATSREQTRGESSRADRGSAARIPLRAPPYARRTSDWAPEGTAVSQGK
jgi:hypothetical protein